MASACCALIGALLDAKGWCVMLLCVCFVESPGIHHKGKWQLGLGQVLLDLSILINN